MKMGVYIVHPWVSWQMVRLILLGVSTQ